MSQINELEMNTNTIGSDLQKAYDRKFSRLLAKFDIKQLRSGQHEVITSLLNGNHTLAIMPTGAGKSLCYQIPSQLFTRSTLVVSPLISLMKDQIEHLDEVGVAAEQIHSSLSAQELSSATNRIGDANSKIIFATPEKVTDPDFQQLLRQTGIDLFVIDEAHCISQWGHDFRPAYLELSNAIKALGDPIVLALTATATEDVCADITQQLGLKSLNVINTGIFRRNLQFRVVHVTNDQEKLQALLDIIAATQGSAIVYAATVVAVEKIHLFLTQNDVVATKYHGKLKSRERATNQELFMQDGCRIMVATNAFGMGIDKEDVRLVIHYQIPGNLEAYYQESGRAGRDGQEAQCVLLYDLNDKRIQQFFLARHYPGLLELRNVYKAIQSHTAERTLTSKTVVNKLSDISKTNIKVTLKLLKDARLVKQDKNGVLETMQSKLDENELGKMAEAYSHKQEYDREMLEQMVSYAQGGGCRWRTILEYFGDDETQFTYCGICDNCLQPPKPILEPVVDHNQTAEKSNINVTLPHFEIGNAVKIKRFGKGFVTEVIGNQVTVRFNNQETRTFMSNYVSLF